MLPLLLAVVALAGAVSTARALDSLPFIEMPLYIGEQRVSLGIYEGAPLFPPRYVLLTTNDRKTKEKEHTNCRAPFHVVPSRGRWHLIMNTCMSFTLVPRAVPSLDLTRPAAI